MTGAMTTRRTTSTTALLLSLSVFLVCLCTFASAFGVPPRRTATTTITTRIAHPSCCWGHASSRTRHHYWVGPLGLSASASEEDTTTTSTTTADSVIDFDSLMEMDCFVYSRNNNDDNTKRILELGVLEERVLQPICAWTLEEAFDDYLEFVVDEEDRYSIKEKDVTVHAVIPPDALSYGSRQVGGGKGPGNPHGEESELLYYIHKDTLEQLQVEGLQVTVKPELEILW